LCFFEGPPSANGLPGIHQVARAIKDIFCRYKRKSSSSNKASWDTHGLPVELGTEKELNYKEDKGKRFPSKNTTKRVKKP
jgi:isoleucyl-tRNA synthetase